MITLIRFIDFHVITIMPKVLNYAVLITQWTLTSVVAVSYNYGKIESDALPNFSYLNLKQFNTIKIMKIPFGSILSNALNVEVACELYALVPIDYLYHAAITN